jgi:hypothetical protein
LAGSPHGYGKPQRRRLPIEERSLKILDGEKALAVETTKRLFTTGALSLDLLACYPIPIPFPCQNSHEQAHQVATMIVETCADDPQRWAALPRRSELAPGKSLTFGAWLNGLAVVD